MGTSAEQLDSTPVRRSAELPASSAGPHSAAVFPDNRPVALAQRQQQALINTSSRLQPGAAMQAHLNQRAVAAAPQTSPAHNTTTGLPDHLKASIEALSGYSLDDVRVHYNSNKPAQLQAHAYAQGAAIHVALGQEQHLPHEAWHVVQQKQGRVRATQQLKGVGVNDDAGLEKEADAAGAAAARSSLITQQPLLVKPLLAKPLATTSNPIQGFFYLNPRDGLLADENGIPPVGEIVTFKKGKWYHSRDFETMITGKWVEIACPLPKSSSAGKSAQEEKEESKEPVATPSIATRPTVKTKGPFAPSTSSVAVKDTDEDDVAGKWTGLNTVTFYEKARASLAIARNPKHKDQQQEIDNLDELINSYNAFPAIKKLIDGYVRVRSVKAKGAASRTGLDELFKTSQTMKYLELSYRPPSGVSSVAKFKGQEFDWLDAQQQIRLSTELILWAGDLVGQISDHTGSLQEKYKNQWMTSEQALMHELRDAAISARSNPATAIVEAINMHLRITVSVGKFTHMAIYRGADAEHALTTAGKSLKSVYNNILGQIGRHRDMLKTYLDFFREHAEPPPGSSPMRGRLGGDQYYPESPKQYDDEEYAVKESLGRVKGNLLPNLAPQWRMQHEGPQKSIPPKPMNPAVQAARKAITKHPKLGSKVSQRIHAAAKRQAKKLQVDEDSGPKDVDRAMVLLYQERL